MSENPHSLDRQLAHNVLKFLENTGLSQRQLCKLAGIGDPANLNGWLGGYKNLSSEKLGNLHRIINLGRFELEKKFTRNVAGRIISLQEKGREVSGELRFTVDGSGWTPREGDSAADPNNRGDTITDVASVNGEPSDDELTDVLRQVNNLHRQALQMLNDYAGKIQKSRPNPNGSTEPKRRIDDNTRSQRPGPKPAQFSRR